MSKEMILEILAAGPMCPKDIVSTLVAREGESFQDISTQLFELVDEGEIDYAPGSRFKVVTDA